MHHNNIGRIREGATYVTEEGMRSLGSDQSKYRLFEAERGVNHRVLKRYHAHGARLRNQLMRVVVDVASLAVEFLSLVVSLQ